MATPHQNVKVCLNNGIAVTSTVIMGIALINHNRCQAATVTKGGAGDGGNGGGDGDGGDADTSIEGVVADGCDGGGDGDGGEATATVEGVVADGCDGVGDAVMLYAIWDNNIAIYITIIVTTRWVDHLYLVQRTIGNGVIQRLALVCMVKIEGFYLLWNCQCHYHYG